MLFPITSAYVRLPRCSVLLPWCSVSLPRCSVSLPRGSVRLPRCSVCLPRVLLGCLGVLRFDICHELSRKQLRSVYFDVGLIR